MSSKMWSGVCHVRLREGAWRRGVHKTQIEGVLCKVWRRVKELCVGAELERWGYHMIFSLVIDWMLTCRIIGVSGLVSCCGSSCGRNRDTFAWADCPFLMGAVKRRFHAFTGHMSHGGDCDNRALRVCSLLPERNKGIHNICRAVVIYEHASHNQLFLHLQERRLCAHPFLEIYREGQIHFMAPLARQGDFYVPEVRRAERRLSEEDELHSDSDISGRCAPCCAAW